MIRIFSYSKTSTRMETPGIAELPQHLSDSDRVVWVDLEDPNDEEVGVLGGIFNFHVLAAEDCIHGNYLPKLDGYDTYAFAVLHAVDLAELEHGFQTVEVGFFIGERFLVTHHAKQVKGVFDARGQVAKNPGTLLRSADWLLHGIVDAMVDHYSMALDALSERIARVELASPQRDPQAVVSAQALTVELSHLCRLGRLQSDVLGRIANGELTWISDPHEIYFQNVHAHMVRVKQMSDFLHDQLSGALVACGVLSAQQTERATRVLTAVASIAAPLLLIASLFDVELNAALGLSEAAASGVALGLIVLIGGGIFGLFKWKRWI